MRIRKEITLDEFNNFRDKLNENIQKEAKKLSHIESIVSDSKNELLKVEQFIEILKTKILDDDNAVLGLGAKLFDKIYVENTSEEETKKKAKLHIKLKIFDYEECNLSLSNLFLLTQHDEGTGNTNCGR